MNDFKNKNITLLGWSDLAIESNINQEHFMSFPISQVQVMDDGKVRTLRQCGFPNEKGIDKLRARNN